MAKRKYPTPSLLAGTDPNWKPRKPQPIVEPELPKSRVRPRMLCVYCFQPITEGQHRVPVGNRTAHTACTVADDPEE